MALTELDRTLLARCLTGDAVAWKDFVDRFIGLFTHVIHHTAQLRSVELTQADIDDLSSDIFLAIVANRQAVLRNFRGNSSLATYLTVVARRVVVREMTRRRMAEALGHVGLQNESLSSTGSSGSAAQAVDDREELERLLQELPETECQVMRLYHLEGHSYREISSELGIPENTIGSVLSRAREKLKQINVGSSTGS